MSRFMFGAMGAGGVPGNDSYTKALLHFDGANGGTTFVDSNVGNPAGNWSRTGSCTTITTSPKFGYGCYQGAGSSNIQSPITTGYDVGTNPFCVDFWVKNLTSASGQFLAIFGDGSGTGGAQDVWSIFTDSSNNLRFGAVYAGVAGINVIANMTPIQGSSWHHVAAVRNGNTFTLYFDGVSSGTNTLSNALASGTMYLKVGGANGGSFAGQIDEFRYSVGTPRWTSNFTPPTGPYI